MWLATYVDREGIAPSTSSLQMRRSATELTAHSRKSQIPNLNFQLGIEPLGFYLTLGF